MHMNHPATPNVTTAYRGISTSAASLLLFGCLLLTACGDGPEAVPASNSGNSEGREQAVAKFGQSPQYEGKLTTLAEINIRNAKLEQVLANIDYAWAFEFTSDTEILLTQHGGRLLHINLETKQETPIEGLPVLGKGFTQIGLMDVELHPDFAENQRIYISYAAPNPEANTYHQTEVATGILKDNRIVELRTLLNTGHYGWAPSNFGGAMEFDADGYLYVSTGDRGNDPLSRAGHRLEGKVLRLNDDGSAALDNPFVNTEGYDPRIFAQGLRNAQGLHFDKSTGLMFESEHGPLGGDEVNILKAGLDYGWPTISHGNNYATGEPIGQGTHAQGLQQPLYYFLPSIAASPLTVYRGDMFSEWEGDILVGALKGEHIAKLDFDEGQIKSSRAILSEVGGRIRDIKVATDGSIYILSQTHGLHRLFREPPAPPIPPVAAKPGQVAAAPPPVDAPHPGKQYYDIVCSGCHDNGATGAPILGDYKAWKPIMDQPRELTKERVLNGYNAMPERGLCHACSDFGLRQMVDYMFAKAQENASE